MNSKRRKSKDDAPSAQDIAPGGLAGEMLRPIKITLLGAGSSFTPHLVNDVLRIPSEKGGIIALVDIDAKRLQTMHKLVEKLIAKLRKLNWKVISASNRKEMLRHSDYVVNCVEVSGTTCVKFDNDIPLKYGVDQCIGDTVGPGGLFKALRTIPVWLQILEDCEALCPEALVLNYTNPMSMLCVAAGRTSSMKVVGLCHSVQATSHLLAQYAGVSYPEMEWQCAGINHLAWFTTLRYKGANLYPGLYKKFSHDISAGIAEYEAGLAQADSKDNSHGTQAHVLYSQIDLIRKDMCVHFGAFVTESSGHLSEYLAYYRKSEAGRRLLRLAYEGGSRFYASNWPRWRKCADLERMAMLKGTTDIGWERTWEYASWIIEACEKNTPYRFHGNVMNQYHGAGPLITNLPANGCVEVACLADRNGIQPTRFGALPSQMAAISSSNMALFDLGAQAGIERSIEKAIYALMLDPLTAAVCTPSQIKEMTLKMFAAERSFLGGYK